MCPSISLKLYQSCIIKFQLWALHLYAQKCCHLRKIFAPQLWSQTVCSIYLYSILFKSSSLKSAIRLAVSTVLSLSVSPKIIAHKVKNQIPLVSYIGSWTILAFWFLVSSNKCFMLSLCLWKGMILSLSNEKDFSSFGSSFSRLPASNRLLFLNPYIGSYCTPHFRIGNFYSLCSYLVCAY